MKGRRCISRADTYLQKLEEWGGIGEREQVYHFSDVCVSMYVSAYATARAWCDAMRCDAFLCG